MHERQGMHRQDNPLMRFGVFHWTKLVCKDLVTGIGKTLVQNNCKAVSQTTTGITITNARENPRKAISPRQSGFFLI